MMTTRTIIVIVKTVLTIPWKCSAGLGPVAIGRKLSRTLMKPAVKVVTDRNASGVIVVQAYRARPRLMRMVVPIASATAASNWLAMPNIGQIVLMLPVEMK